jgi:hypothetical protein
MSWKNCRSISGFLKMSNPSYYILILVYHVSKMGFTNSTIFQITSSVLSILDPKMINSCEFLLLFKSSVIVGLSYLVFACQNVKVVRASPVVLSM